MSKTPRRLSKGSVNLLRRKLSLVEVTAVFGVIFALPTLFGFFGRWHWFLDLFSHFRGQYAAGLGLVAVVFALLKSWKLSLAAFVLALLNASALGPLFFARRSAGAEGASGHRFLVANVETANSEHDKIRRFIEEARPELVALQEIDDVWIEALHETLARFPHSRVEARPDNFGIGLWSKHPIKNSEIRFLGLAEVPTIVAEVELPSGTITVICTHPVPPGGRTGSYLRNEQLAVLAQAVKAAANPVLLVGDLNTTPWNYHFKQLLRDSGLRDSARGFGWQPTWPTRMPLFYIPLDHCLHSDAIGILDRQTGPNVGSDHRPLLVEFAR